MEHCFKLLTDHSHHPNGLMNKTLVWAFPALWVHMTVAHIHLLQLVPFSSYPLQLLHAICVYFFNLLHPPLTLLLLFQWLPRLLSVWKIECCAVVSRSCCFQLGVVLFLVVLFKKLFLCVESMYVSEWWMCLCKSSTYMSKRFCVTDRNVDVAGCQRPDILTIFVSIWAVTEFKKEQTVFSTVSASSRNGSLHS